MSSSTKLKLGEEDNTSPPDKFTTEGTYDDSYDYLDIYEYFSIFNLTNSFPSHNLMITFP